MNPGGIRADLVENGDGDVTYGAAFAVQPFNNLVASMDLTGAEIKAILNQQWNGGNEGTNRKILQVSGLSYTWDLSDAALTGANAIVGDVLVDADGDPGTADGRRCEDGTTYRVAINNFIADGGDNFTVLRDQGENRITGGLDIDSLVDYLGANDPVTADADGPDLAAALIRARARRRGRRGAPAPLPSVRVVRPAQRTASRSTTKTRVSPGLITPPAPRSP